MFVCFLHISKDNVKNIQKYNFINVINFFTFEINTNSSSNTNWILLKFIQKEKINNIKKYIRPNKLISLCN